MGSWVACRLFLLDIVLQWIAFVGVFTLLTIRAEPFSISTNSIWESLLIIIYSFAKEIC